MKKPRLFAGLVLGAVYGLGGLGVTLDAAQEPSPAPPAQHPSELYKKYCSKCHGDDGRAKTFKGKLMMARNFTDAEWQAGVTDEQLVKSVTEGKDDMPPWGKKLTAAEIESLVRNDVRGFAPKKN